MMYYDKDTLALAKEPNKVGICIGYVVDLDGKSLYVMRCPGPEYYVGGASMFSLIRRFDDDATRTVIIAGKALGR